MNLHIRVLHNGLTTKMFSAECGSPLNSSRVASANLVLYPTIIPAHISHHHLRLLSVCTSLIQD